MIPVLPLPDNTGNTNSTEKNVKKSILAKARMAVTEQVRKEILERYERRESYRTIAHEMRLSLRDISEVIKADKAAGETSKETEVTRQVTDGTGAAQVVSGAVTENQAPKVTSADVFKAFKEGKSPTQTIIDLKIEDTEWLRKRYREYLELEGMAGFLPMYKDLGEVRIRRINEFLTSLDEKDRKLDDAMQKLDDALKLQSLETEIASASAKLVALKSEIVQEEQKTPGLNARNNALSKTKEELEKLCLDMQSKLDETMARYEIYAKHVLSMEAGRIYDIVRVANAGVGFYGNLTLIRYGDAALIHTLRALAKNPEQSIKLLRGFVQKKGSLTAQDHFDHLVDSERISLRAYAARVARDIEFIAHEYYGVPDDMIKALEKYTGLVPRTEVK